MGGMRIDLDREFMKRLQENLNKEKKAMLDEIAVTIQANVKGEITRAGLVDTGHLRLSIEKEVRTTPRGGFAVVGTNSLYALPLELGIKNKFFPNLAMVRGLFAWAKRKGLPAFGPSKASGFVLHYLKIDQPKEPDLLNTAAVIALKIGRSGFKKGSYGFFEKGFFRLSRQIPEIIERFTRRAAALTNVGTL